MTARDQLAEYLRQPILEAHYSGPQGSRDVYHAQALAAADAVIGMVKPLEWVNSYGVWRAATPFGDYKVTGRILTLPIPMNPQQVHSDEEAAKAAADAHNRAQILAALGLNTGEGRT